MAKILFTHVKVSGVATIVPPKEIRLEDELEYYGNDLNKIARLQATVGIRTRRVVSGNTTPADLCEQVANKLLKGMGVDRESIDALICVLDFPDYKCPPTACILHGKLNLPTSCLAFDINHGCTGYIYGMYVASALINAGGCDKVLLLVGDTKSRTINIKDRVTAPIFGDGASATLLERCTAEKKSYFCFGTDGKKSENIMIPAGGARQPCSEETKKEIADSLGNVRTLENFTMNGRNVFDFTMNAVPQNIKDILEFAGINVDEIDYAVLHQANKSIINNIASRAGIHDMAKVPTETLAKFGNLAVASIPSVLNDQLHEVLSHDPKKILMSGFGVGLSYGTAIMEFEGIYCPNIFEYEETNDQG